MRNLKDVILIVFLFVLSLVDGAWSACYQGALVRGVVGSPILCDCFSCPSTAYCGVCPDGVVFPNSYPNRFFYDGSNINLNSRYCLNNGSSCGAAYNSLECSYTKWCDTQNDLDSLRCVNDGYNWEFDEQNGMYYCNQHLCDSTMHCNSYVHNRCIDVGTASQITCVNGECSGLPGALFYSQVVTECTNECGTNLSSIISSDTVFAVGKSCDDDIVCGSEVLCGEFGNGTYFLFRKCLVGRETVGNVNEREQIPQIEYSGHGTCAENGYQPTSCCWLLEN